VIPYNYFGIDQWEIWAPGGGASLNATSVGGSTEGKNWWKARTGKVRGNQFAVIGVRMLMSTVSE